MSQSEVLELSDREAIFSLIFLGGDADQSRLDLYDDAVSLGGFARTLAIIGHFYITGDVIAHAPKSKLQLYAVSSEEGSFKQSIIAGAVSGIIAAPFGIFASRLIDNWIPQPNNELKQIIQLLEEQNKILGEKGVTKESSPHAINPDDALVNKFIHENRTKMQVLRSITSNSFKNIFRPIGRSADAVVLAEGEKPRPFGAVDPPTLARIEADEVDNETTIVDATVNAFSRSSKTGIAFPNNLVEVFGSNTQVRN